MGGPRIAGLFEGYGGLTRAVLEVLGGELVWYSENELGACKVLAHHHPDVPNLGDITQIDWASVLPVDILAGGWPCQDISNAGKQAGIEGARSGLWRYLIDAVRVLRPRLVVLENVSAVIVRGFDRVVTDLATVGYDVRWTCVRASDVGAPHRRERFFAIAVPSVARGVGSNPAGDRRDEGRSEPAGIERGLDAALSGAVVPHANGAARGERRLAASGQAQSRGARADAGRRGGTPATNTEGERHGHTGQAGVGGVPASAVAGDQRATAADTNFSGLEGAEPEAGQELPARSAVAWGQFEPAIRRWESAIGRPAPEPTIPGRRDNRVLNPAFVEWLMGLPEGHVTAVPGLSRNDMLKLLGNGVVPAQAAAALRHLLPNVMEVAA